MPRKPMPWFRFYVETVGDPKIRRIPFDKRWLWAAILSAARESPRPGWLYIAENVPMTFQELADYSGAPLKVIGPTLALMGDLAMIETVGGAIHVINFDSRQPESDNVTARTQKHRERSRERSTERPNGVPGNVRRNAPEKEVEEEVRERTLNLSNTGRSLNAPREIEDPIPENCPSHPNGTDEPCGACAGLRKRREARDAAELARRLNEVMAAKAARDACARCDPDGWILDPDTAAPVARCEHQPPDRPNGLNEFTAAAVAAALDRPGANA